MNPALALLAAVVGYLAGSITFARVVMALAHPARGYRKLEVSVPDTDIRIESDAVSATAVRLQLGNAYGCLTGALDMLKAAVPALIFRLAWPDQPYYLFAAGMATVGHNWPLYFGFKGGRGMSPTVGGMLVVDWVGVLVTHAVAIVIGLPLKNTVIFVGGGIFLIIPWLIFRGERWPEAVYALLMNIIFWSAMRPELRQFARLKREGTLETFEQAEELRVAERRGSEAFKNVSLDRWVSQVRARLGRR